jgi:hypothetical protein
MKLELILTRDLYLTGENINVDIQLTNTGSTAVDAPRLASRENAQPVYLLRGPSHPNGVTFNFRDSRPGAGSVPDPEPSTHPLLPGAMMETGFTLNSIQPVSEPGDYAISARIDWGGWSAEATPIKFRVEKAKFVESSLGVDVFARSARTLRAVWIAESAAGRMLGESFLYESRPDLGEVKVSDTRIIRKVGQRASDPFCPWVNFDRSESMKFWHGWQEGTQLVAFSDDEGEPRTFDMGSSKARIVQPAYMSRSGDLEVLVLGENRKTLRLIRFLPQAPKSSATVAWTIDLPEESVAIRAGIGSQEEGGSRVAASVSLDGTRMAIRLIRVGEKSAEVGPPSLIDNAFALPDSEPSVSIAPDGSVQAAVLFARHPGLRTLAVADLTSRRNDKGDIVVSDAGLAPAAVVRAWTTQRVTSEGQPARRWLIRTVNGSVFGGPGLVPVAAGAAVVDFLRMSAATYVLALDPDRGPHLVATDF